jgi:hypothetical protein
VGFYWQNMNLTIKLSGLVGGASGRKIFLNAFILSGTDIYTSLRFKYLLLEEHNISKNCNFTFLSRVISGVTQGSSFGPVFFATIQYCLQRFYP